MLYLNIKEFFFFLKRKTISQYPSSLEARHATSRKVLYDLNVMND